MNTKNHYICILYIHLVCTHHTFIICAIEVTFQQLHKRMPEPSLAAPTSGAGLSYQESKTTRVLSKEKAPFSRLKAQGEEPFSLYFYFQRAVDVKHFIRSKSSHDGEFSRFSWCYQNVMAEIPVNDITTFTNLRKCAWTFNGYVSIGESSGALQRIGKGQA